MGTPEEILKNAFGGMGLLLLSAIVGVADIDPFILSLIHGSAAAEKVLVSAILIAMMSNTVVKGIYFGTLAKSVRKETFWRYGLWALLHVPFVLLR